MPPPGPGPTPGAGWTPVGGTPVAGAVPPNPEVPNPAPGTGHQAPYQQVPYAPHPGFGDPAVPPIPPPYWRRREPIGAVILIGLGLIFLLNQMGYVTARIVHFSWPLVLIALGVWLILRRAGSVKGGQQ